MELLNGNKSWSDIRPHFMRKCTSLVRLRFIAKIRYIYSMELIIHLLWCCRTSDLVEGVLQGRNGTVFCYGATGAGKTYTMLGTMESPGVMVLAIKDLFTKVRQRSHDGNHSIQLSYLEVYNETVRDLLSPGRPLLLREDKQVSALNHIELVWKKSCSMILFWCWVELPNTCSIHAQW